MCLDDLTIQNHRHEFGHLVLNKGAELPGTQFLGWKAKHTLHLVMWPQDLEPVSASQEMALSSGFTSPAGGAIEKLDLCIRKRPHQEWEFPRLYFPASIKYNHRSSWQYLCPLAILQKDKTKPLRTVAKWVTPGRDLEDLRVLGISTFYQEKTVRVGVWN